MTTQVCTTTTERRWQSPCRVIDIPSPPVSFERTVVSTTVAGKISDDEGEGILSAYFRIKLQELSDKLDTIKMKKFSDCIIVALQDFQKCEQNWAKEIGSCGKTAEFLSSMKHFPARTPCRYILLNGDSEAVKKFKFASLKDILIDIPLVTQTYLAEKLGMKNEIREDIIQKISAIIGEGYVKDNSIDKKVIERVKYFWKF
jgi:hypothetical protein